MNKSNLHTHLLWVGVSMLVLACVLAILGHVRGHSGDIPGSGIPLFAGALLWVWAKKRKKSQLRMQPIRIRDDIKK